VDLSNIKNAADKQLKAPASCTSILKKKLISWLGDWNFAEPRLV
jgi:hypothetical protein